MKTAVITAEYNPFHKGHRLSLIHIFQRFALAALRSFQNNPFDEMLLQHWVSHFANGNGDLVAFYACGV